MGLNIIFDATPFSFEKPTGAGRYLVNLLDSLGRIDRENNYFVFGFEKELPHMGTWPDNFTYQSIEQKRIFGPFAIEWATRSFVNKFSNQQSVDIYQSNLDPFTLKDRGVKTVCMLYDVMRLSPEFKTSTPQTPRTKIRTKMRYANAGKYDHILTISEYSKSQITNHLGIPENRITVTHLAAEKGFSPGDADEKTLKKYSVTRPFALFVGEFGRQKNENGLIEAFSMGLDKKSIPDDLALILVGDKSRMPENTIHLISKRKLENKVRLIGSVNEYDLVQLYRAALFFVLPSFSEGFGLPALEAMASGTPVIVSNVTSLPEVVGDAGVIVSPYSPEEIISAIGNMCLNENARAELIEKGIYRAKIFSYKSVAQKTLDAYRKVMQTGTS